jgi:hypothetical protein
MDDTEKALRMFSIAALPGVFLVDTLPFCTFLSRPNWIRSETTIYSEVCPIMVPWCRIQKTWDQDPRFDS